MARSVRSRRALRALAGAAIIAAGTSACVSTPSARPEPSLVGAAASLSASDIAVLSSLLEISDARRADTAIVDRALSSTSAYVRAYGARVIGQNSIVARAGALRALVMDPDTSIAADAAFALGLLRDSTAAPVLRDALLRSPTIVDAAAWSLGELGTSGRAVLEGVLTTGQPRGALSAALQSSTKLRPVPAALIVAHLNDADVLVRRSAAYAVTRSRVPASARALVQLEIRRPPTQPADRDADTDLWSYVARGLGQPAAGDSLGAEAQSALRRLAEHSHPHVRINALRSLATYGAAARAALVAHLQDPDANARIALAQSLGGVLGADVAAWNAAWAADTGFTYRRSLLPTAMRARVRLPALDRANAAAWQRHSDWRYRAAAAQAAGAGAWSDADDIAGGLLRDADARVRNAAWGTLLAWADSTAASGKPYARAALGEALGERDLFVRASILDAFRSLAQAPEAAPAFRAWRQAASDPENDARVAALRVIAAAWTRDSSAFRRELTDSLRAALLPADPVERSIGSSSSLFAHWSASVGTSRAPAWYALQVRTFVVPELAGKSTRVAINTSRGTVEVRLFGADAPLTVANFVSLVRRGYYNRLAFHRVVPNFVAQDGDPRGDGSGGPGYAIRDELNRRWYERGAVGMALSGPDTGGSQYFIAHSPQPHLDGHYTVFGHVIGGLDVLDAIVQGDAIISVVVQ